MEKAKLSQWKGWLRKQPVKESEIAWVGLNEVLAGRKNSVLNRLAREAAERRAQAEALEEFGDEFDPLAFLQLQVGDVDVIPTGEKDPVVAREALLGWLAENETTIETSILTADHDLVYSPGMRRVKLLQRLLEEHGSPKPIDWSKAFDHVFLSAQVSRFVEEAMSDQGFQSYTGIANRIVHRAARMLFTDEQWAGLPVPSRIQAEREMTHYAFEETGLGRMSEIQKAVDGAAGQVVDALEAEDPSVVGEFMEDYRRWADSYLADEVQYDAYRRIDVLQGALARFQEGAGTTTHKNAAQYTSWSVPNPYHHIRNQREFGVRLGGKFVWGAPHWSDVRGNKMATNLIAHARTSDRIAFEPVAESLTAAFDEKDVLLAEELQSDWSTARRRYLEGMDHDEITEEIVRVEAELEALLEEALEDRPAEDMEGDLSILVEEPGDPRGDIVGVAIRTFADGEARTFRGDTREDVVRQIEDAGLDQIGADLFYVTDADHFIRQTEATQMYRAWTTAEIDETLAEGGSIPLRRPATSLRALWTMVSSGRELNRDGQPAGADLSQLKPWNIEAAGNRHEELLIYLRRALRLLDEHHELDRREFAGRTHRETPDTPWTAAEDWLGLLVRRLLTAGVREGYDAVAFSTAEMVNELFNLESQVRVVWAYRHFPGTGGSEISDASGVHFVAYKHDGSVALARTYPSEEAAAQDFGSPIAERVFEQVDQERGRSFRLMKVDEALEFLTDDGLSAPVLRELRKEFAERGSLSGWWRVEQEKGTIYVGVVGDHSLESDPEAFIMKNGHTQPSGPALLYADTNIMFFQADAEARQRLEEQHNSPGWRARWGSIVVVPGSELSVGGRWQRQLYDEILPRVLRNELKWLTGKTQAPRVERRYLSDVERIKVSNLPHTDRYEVHLTGMPSPGIDEPLEDGRITVAVVDTEEQAQKIRNSLRKQYPHHTAEYTLLPAGGQVGRRAGARYRPAAWYVELTPEVRRAVLEEGFRVMERPRQLSGPEAWAAWAERRNPPERAPTNPTEEERAEMVREQLSLAFGGPEPAKRISERLAAALGSKAHMVTDGVYNAEARREIIETAREARAWVDMRGQQLDYKDPRSVIELLEWTRSPEAESLSFFGLDDDGRIVRQETLSTGAIDYAWVDEPTTNRILREMKEAGATRLIMSHNHPSGDPTMSKEDTYHAAVVAGMASRAGLELQASIVVNHEAAQVWLPFTEQFPEEGVQDDEATVERLDFKDLGMVFEYTIPRRRRFDWTQAARFQIRGPESIVELAASIGGDQDGFSVVWVDTQLRVATVTQHAAEAAASLHEWAPDMQRDFAAYGYMIYVGDNASPSTYQDIIQAANARGLHRNGPDMPVPQGLVDVVLGSTRLGTARSALEEEELVGVPERLRASGTTFVREDLPDYGGDPTSPRADDPEVTKQDLKVWEWLQETFETIGLPMALDDYNVLSRRVLGAYWAWPTYVLLRNPTDIATASHEIGHHIHKLFFGLHRRGLSGTVLAPWSAELIGVAREQGFRKSRQTRKEGLAEFFSLYVTDPARARSLAPTFYRYADTRLRNEFSVLHDALQELSERYRLWQDAPMEARADARIADKRNPLHTLRDARRNAWRRLRYEVLDDLVYIEQFDEEFDATGMTNVLARTARGAAGAGETFLSLGALDFETVDVVGPGLDEILAPVTGDRKEYKQFRRWATAIRAVELAELGIETGFDIAEQRAIIEKYESDEYREVFDQIQEWNGHLLQYLVDSGVISQELMDKLRDKHPNYLPFFRSGFDENDAMRIGGKQFAHIFSPIKKIKGSERQLLDPLVSLARLAYSYTSVAHRQELNTRLIQVAGQEGTGGWIRKIPPPTRVTRVGKQEVTDFIMGSIMSQPDPEAEGLEIGEDVFDALEEVMMVFRPGHYFGQDNIISRLDPETGKRTWYWVNDDLYGSISALKGKELDTWVRIAANPSRWLRAGATGTPDFAVRNLFRDQPWSTVMSENIHVPFEHATRGFIHRFRNYRTGAKVDPTVAKMKATGGEFAALVDMDREWIKTTTKALLRDGVPNVVTHPIQLFALISRGTENLSRTGEFAAAVKRLRAQGYEGRELYQRASLHAREVGTDYMRRGSSETIQAIRMIATFWNATTQSWDRLGRAFSNRKVEGTGLRRWQLTTMKALGLITLPTMLLWLVNHDDEEWQEFPQWQRDLFWLVKIPRSWGGLVPDLLSADVQDTGLGRSLADRALLRRIQPFVEGSEGHVWLRVPKPFQLGIMFASIPERILDYLATGDERGVRDAVQTFIGVDPTLQAKGLGRRLQDFWSSDVGQVVIPDIQVIMPFAENFANYSRFLERPIVSRGDEGLQPWLQHGPYASEVAKELGFYLNYSPAKIDNVIQAWTGGMGQYALDAAELAGDAVGMWDRQDRPSGGITTMPFTRSFFAGPPGFGSESIERFFDEWDLASRAYRTQRALLREEDPRADEHFDANEELIMRYRMLEQVRQRIQEYRDLANVYAEDTTISRRARDEIQNQLGADATDLARDAIGRDLPGDPADPLLPPE